ncbi:phage terminase small subunit [Companilactobacillus allii]|uniref:PBSX phage terminase small subunit-like N-terminal domain-containing protein n=1 Tax=Companilactobacillus allii TaxID=1847728 RepID=A0A1P8Q4U4_9LACO|nr:phage terminase small subunit [Companilactobacillus allii]APX72874.1 hypothetical protein BTM29_10065 [Companilactobacillus allii]USQ67662.1 phage terminase small subunit [Companilactobacillus allii]
MARPRSPQRNKAMKIWLDSNGSKPLVDIAKELNVPASRIRKWKSQDKWKDKLKRSVPLSKGSAPFESLSNNKNAVGNSGGAAPPGNKNAVTTGQYETILLDELSDEEQKIFKGVTDDPLVSINTEIRQLKVRQYRITKRIKDVVEGMNDKEIQTFSTIKERPQTFTDDDGNQFTAAVPITKPFQSATQSYRKFDDLLKLEDALTAVGNSLQKAIREKAKIMNIPYDQELIKGKAKIAVQQARIAEYQADKLTNSGIDNPILKTIYEHLRKQNGSEMNEDID